MSRVFDAGSLMVWVAGALLLVLGVVPRVAAADVVEYIHTDPLGSPVAVTNASGVVIERTVYGAYGEVINRPLAGGPGYTGHVEDAETGLNYMQQRYYEPGIGRFLSVDPVTINSGTGGNFNRYRYANNNPYKFTDPDGRLACSIGNARCQEQLKELEERGIPAFQAGASGSKSKSDNSDCAECDEVRATRAGIIREGGERLKEAGVYGAKEAGWMLAGGPIGKLLGKIGRALSFAGKEVSFGRNGNQLFHTFRHVEDAGLNREAVRRAVQTDLRVSASRIEAGKPFNQTISVDGTQVTYTAFRLEDGSINVGRITLPD